MAAIFVGEHPLRFHVSELLELGHGVTHATGRRWWRGRRSETHRLACFEGLVDDLPS